MAEIIDAPVRIPVPVGKTIEEYVGRVASGDAAVSVAHMRAPAGWDEPFQAPDFDEFTVVLEGALVIDTPDGELRVAAGQADHASGGAHPLPHARGSGVRRRVPAGLQPGDRSPRGIAVAWTVGEDCC